MTLLRLSPILALIASAAQLLAAQAPEPAASQPAAQAQKTAATQPAKTNYETGDWLHWQKMTGNWGGARTALADMGITFDVDVTQILQGNAHGGASTVNGIRYSGSGDVTLNIDTGKLGLWPGGSFLLNGEPHWGNGINKKVGSLVPVNLDAYKPGEGCFMTLSEVIYQQVLFDGKLILIGGKLDGSRAFDRNIFANDERTQFLNAALRNNVMIPAFLPYTDWGVGAIVNPTDWLSILTAVADSQGSNHTTGFETAFHGPTSSTVIHELDFKIKPFGLPGDQRVGFAWSSLDAPKLNPISPFKETGPLLMKYAPDILETLGPYLPHKTVPDNVMLYYNFDQYLYTEKDDPTQGIGLFGRFGWARPNTNPVNYYYSIGVGGKGIIPDRDNDTFGVGYYYVDLSNDLPPAFFSEQGVECFYNIQIAPWLHISPDLQIIMNPGGTSQHETSLVYGFRMQIDL